MAERQLGVRTLLRRVLRGAAPLRPSTPPKPAPKPALPPGMSREVAGQITAAGSHALIHIGKTGGTSLRKLIRALQIEAEKASGSGTGGAPGDTPLSLAAPGRGDRTIGVQKTDVQAGDVPPGLHKFRHDVTLTDICRLRPDLKVGFVFREPSARFVSGFYSRLRAGRPQYSTLWTPAEAVAFSYFPTAGSLAEALYHSDERLRSAAEFAMQHIRHLARGYGYYFGSPDELAQMAGNIYCLCELPDLASRAGEFFAPFAIPAEEITRRLKTSHEATARPPPLSELALANLRQFWAGEYALYEALRRLDAERRPG